MAAEQTLIVTAMPRALTLDGPTLPVSISVSVRLRGASKLGAFPDLRHWVHHLRNDGLSIELQCAGRTLRVPVTPPGEPDLWEKLFRTIRSSNLTLSTTTPIAASSHIRFATS